MTSALMRHEGPWLCRYCWRSKSLPWSLPLACQPTVWTCWRVGWFAPGIAQVGGALMVELDEHDGAVDAMVKDAGRFDGARHIDKVVGS